MRRRLAVALLLLLFSPGVSAGESLADEVRVATVTNVAGAAFVRAAGADRAAILVAGAPLAPGSVVRVPTRGANAVEIRLAAGGGVVAGPGTIVAFPEARAVALLRGQAEVAGTEAAPVTVTGPGGFSAEVAGTEWLVAEAAATRLFDVAPEWLTGYRGSTTSEWTGSLVASIDGRDVPLVVADHRVDVVIRDQIAETTVTQTFVNTHGGRREGVFSFPLPAGATVSGFGMWIDGEYVEADVVERQRARAIYEEIRREKMDPALLEWSGGNFFTARVFPIIGEKRIRLRYTQVLPLTGSQYRYRYALRSELLRDHPVKHLSIRVEVASEAFLDGLDSPTHRCESIGTEHEGSLQFEAEEYRPDSDFEAVIRLADPDPVALSAHRRGEDGYFMLLVTPPAGGEENAPSPVAGPLDLVILADTSGSMDPESRKAGAEFVEALLSMLGAKDRFRLGTFDAGVAWQSEASLPATPENADAALDFLANRESLGWTDLDKALSASGTAAKAGTQVVLVTDGIGTAGDPESSALAHRIAGLAPGLAGTFHTVHPGPGFDDRVLDAVSAIGGGTVRGLDGDPARAAAGLLADVWSPGLRDVRVTLTGVRVAKVYPERIPALRAGGQAAFIGRFLPVEGGKPGTASVTATRAGKEVEYQVRFWPEAETGNSFLPRLWARQHLDALLAEGQSAEVRAKIVAFSEEYGIVTPYTSLLVLENDELRERFGVTRRVKMRDGEAFFADADHAVRIGVRRVQMRAARAWRQDLRRKMLGKLARLGRDLVPAELGYGGWRYAVGGTCSLYDVYNYRSTGIPGGATIRIGGGARMDGEVPFDGPMRPASDSGSIGRAADAEEEGLPLLPDEEAEPEPVSLDDGADLDVDFEESLGAPRLAYESHARFGAISMEEEALGAWPYEGYLVPRFPELPPPEAPPDATPEPDWPEEALRAIRSLDRRAAFADPTVPIEVRVVQEIADRFGGGFTPGFTTRALVSRGAWFLRDRVAGTHPTEQWTAAGVRGVLDAAWRLGRTRPADPAADRPYGVGAVVLFGDPLEAWRGRLTEVVSRDGAITVVRLTGPRPESGAIELTIDTEKGLTLLRRELVGGKVVSTVRAEDLYWAGGLCWAGTTTTADGQGRVVVRRSTRAVELTGDRFAAELDLALAGHGDAILLPAADPTRVEAKDAVRAGTAGFAEHYVLVRDAAASGRWDAAFREWEAAKAAAPEKAGLPWLGADLLAAGRKGEELKARLLDLARGLTGRRDETAAVLADDVLELAGRALSAGEQKKLLGLIGDVGPAADVETRKGDAKMRSADLLFAEGKRDEALALLGELLAERPRDPYRLLAILERLQPEQVPADVDRVEAGLPEHDESAWSDDERERVFTRWTNLLYAVRRVPQTLKCVDAWIAAHPASRVASARRLLLLPLLDRVGERDAWIRATFETGPGDGSDPVRVARFLAAVDVTTGTQWRYSVSDTVDRAFLADHVRAVRELARIEGNAGYEARNLLWRYRGADPAVYRKMTEGLLEDLQAGIDTMSAGKLGRYVELIPWGVEERTDQDYAAVLESVRGRYEAAKAGPEREALADVLVRLLDARGRSEEAIRLLRKELDRAAADARCWRAEGLARRFAGLPWSEKVEGLMLSLTAPLAPPRATKDQAFFLYAAKVRWIVSELLRMRVEALLGPEEERAKWTREEAREREKAAREEARAGLAGSLGSVLATAPSDAGPWLSLESLSFRAESGEDAAGTVTHLKSFLRTFSGRTDAGARLLVRRAEAVLSYVAVRPGTPDAVRDGILALFWERATAQERGEGRFPLFRLLVALDRPSELEGLLGKWIEPGSVESRWRIAYAYLRAETGHLAEAADLLEKVADLGELPDSGFTSLADFLLALGDEAKREETIRRRYARLSERALAARLQRFREGLWRRRRETSAPRVDGETLGALRELLSRAPDPSGWLEWVEQVYDDTKDTRLLACLADGVPGHSPEALHAYLEATREQVANVHEEATADAITARIDELLPTAKTDTDRRGLHLLAALVEGTAAKALNAPGPHAERAAAALTAAGGGGFAERERRLVAHFLGGIDPIAGEAARKAHLGLLTSLLAAPATPRELLPLAHDTARTEWAYGRRDAAIDLLSSAMDALPSGESGVPGAEVESALGDLADWLATEGRFSAAEKRLAGVPGRSAALLLLDLYPRAVAGRGALSFGEGETLYREALARLRAAPSTARPSELRRIVAAVRALAVAGKKAGISTAAEDLSAFARDDLPAVLVRIGPDANDVVEESAGTIHDVAGPVAALAFLVGRLDAEPAWTRRVGAWGSRRGLAHWRYIGDEVAAWRKEAKGLADLEPRLLATVTRELSREIRLGPYAPQGAIWNCWGSKFWKEKADDFRRTALAVIEEHPDEPGVVLRAAAYLRGGLRLNDLAIQALLDADARGRLDPEGRKELASWLLSAKRAKEALEQADRYLDDIPGDSDVRLLRVRAFTALGKPDEAGRALDETVALLRSREDRYPLRRAAGVAVGCKLFSRAEALYREVLRQDDEDVGAREGLAVALSGLGRTEEAVEAALVAAFASEYGDSSDALRRVFETAKDRDAWRDMHDAKTARTGRDVPLLRRALGDAYLNLKEHAKASRELRIARDLDPRDERVHDHLIRALDKANEREAAATAKAEELRYFPKDVRGFRDLEKRFRALKKEDEAERALTGFVEAEPLEAEGHRQLAKRWDKARRYEDAVAQWRVVTTLDRLDPEGFLALAAAELKAKRPDAARAALDYVLKTDWPARFGDAHARAAKLLATIPPERGR